MKKSLFPLAGSIALLALAGCSSTLEQRTQKLQLGMTQAAAGKVLGSDYAVVAARLEPDGSPVSVLKFSEDKKPDLFLYFRKDKLTQWGDVEVLKAMPPAVAPPAKP